MENKYSKDDKETLIKIGRKLRQLRMDQKLSQEKLAFACELDRTYLGSVERGERNIAIINLLKITTVLNADLSELLKQ